MNLRKSSFFLLFALGVVSGGALFYLQSSAQTQNEHTLLRMNSARSSVAVQKLASRGDDEKLKLLEAAKNKLAYIESREAAVEALSAYQDESISEELAELLQPHNALSLRQAIGQYLAKSPCPRKCVQAVLSYLYKLRHREKTLESDSKIPAVRKALEQDQRDLNDVLIKVLFSHKADTLRLLIDAYGLSSPVPSGFAIDLVDRISIPEACPQLELSERSTSDVQLRKNISTLMARLKCSKSLPPLRSPSD